MPPKVTRPKAFSWAKGQGKLTPTARGIIYGMHLSSQSAANIAAMMRVTVKTVYQTIKSMETERNGRKDQETPSDSDDDANLCAQHVQQRRELIDEFMLEKKENGHYEMMKTRGLMWI